MGDLATVLLLVWLGVFCGYLCIEAYFASGGEK